MSGLRYLLLLIAIVQNSSLQAVTHFNLMPYPQQLQVISGQYDATSQFTLSISGADQALLQPAAKRFLQRLATQSGQTVATTILSAGGSLHIEIRHPRPAIPQPLEDESYQLQVTEKGIRLQAATRFGALRALETLLQLLQSSQQGYYWPAVTINDFPQYGWRGVLLDPARHFLPVDTIKRQLDLMAAAKLNVLHWHLTDDQGWRLESKVFPGLHQIAGKDGYYSQQQVKEVIQYAAERGIRVVPEIDLPGHTTALGVAYPELMASPAPAAIETHWGVHPAVLDPTKAEVYQFIRQLLAEVAELFPDPYLHIGGDEVLPDHWLQNEHIRQFMQQQQLADAPALQAWFNRQLLDILQPLGKRMIGWDEVLVPELPTSTLIQSWRGQESLYQAAAQGYQTLLSTGYYLDQPQTSAYHYRIHPVADTSAATEIPEPATWSQWQFSFERKRGSAINGQLFLLFSKDHQVQGYIEFNGRSRQPLQQLSLEASRLRFNVDSWMGPITAELQLTPTRLSGSFIVGNAAYQAQGSALALQQTTALPAAAISLPLLTKQQAANILGGEIALWSELITNNNIDTRLWPRALVVAERLWSSPQLQDEQSLYQRLQLLDNWLQHNGSLHRQQYLAGLQPLLPAPETLTALKNLTELLEPAHYYHRLHEKSVKQQYHNQAPLDHLVDFLPAEHNTLRQLSGQLAERPGAELLATLAAKFSQWQHSASTLQRAFEHNPPASAAQAELKALLPQIRQLTTEGLLILQHFDSGKPLTLQQHRQLQQLLADSSIIQAEMILTLPRLLSQLLQYLPASEIWLPEHSFYSSIEGPAFDAGGNLYAVNFQREGTIGRVTPDGQASLYLELPAGSIANGIQFGSDGTMYLADYTGHNILRYHRQKNNLSVHAHNPAMHQPNDLAITASGVIYASDPNWADNSGQLWRINPDGSTVLEEAAMGTTNGIAISPNQQYLYVNESVQRRIWRYRIQSDNSLTDKQLFAAFSDYGMDGMRTDPAGNLYVARYGKGTVIKLSPAGLLLAEYQLHGAYPTNMALNGDTLVVTMQQCGCIEKITLTD